MAKTADLEGAIVETLRRRGGRGRLGEVSGLTARLVGHEIQPPMFEAALGRLVAGGQVRVSRPGGVVHLELAQDAELPPPATPPDGHPPQEQALMAPLRSWLDQQYQHDLDAGGRVLVRDTSRAGGRSGIWSKPDYTVAVARRFRFSTAREVELHGFELKSAKGGTVVGVHEALAQARWVHFPHLVWHVPVQSESRGYEDILSQCARHGVGLITFSEPTALDTWTTVLAPSRFSPDRDEVDSFILQRFENDIDTLTAWMNEE